MYFTLVHLWNYCSFAFSGNVERRLIPDHLTNYFCSFRSAEQRIVVWFVDAPRKKLVSELHQPDKTSNWKSFSIGFDDSYENLNDYFLILLAVFCRNHYRMVTVLGRLIRKNRFQFILPVRFIHRMVL